MTGEMVRSSAKIFFLKNTVKKDTSGLKKLKYNCVWLFVIKKGWNPIEDVDIFSLNTFLRM